MKIVGHTLILMFNSFYILGLFFENNKNYIRKFFFLTRNKKSISNNCLKLFCYYFIFNL